MIKKNNLSMLFTVKYVRARYINQVKLNFIINNHFNHLNFEFNRFNNLKFQI